MKLTITKLVKATCFLLIFSLCSWNVQGQSAVKELLNGKEQAFSNLNAISPFQTSSAKSLKADNAINGEKEMLDIESSFTKKMLHNQSDLLKLTIPVSGTATVTLNLKKVEILDQQFVLSTASNDPSKFEHGIFYWGQVEGYENSTVAINIYGEEMSGVISYDNKSYTLAKMKDADQYILYQEIDLVEQPEISCHTDNVEQDIKEQFEEKMSMANPDNCVKIYVEVDYDLFNYFGSVTAAYNYVSGAFSQVAILYANESINFTVSEILVWDTVDPYTGTSTSDYLNQFTSAMSGGFNGDLAHLVGINGSGGIAYVGVLCANNNRTAYSGINTTYNDVPTYSWTVNVLTHEIGHNLGSPHTHSCSWNGNGTQIDDCGNVYLNDNGYSTPACFDANNPILPAAGTIMSYCHLQSGIGMDFNLGFGQQPGDLIRDRVYNATCLGACVDCLDAGNPCDDGDDCTSNDVIDSFCNCTGTESPDADQDGFCAIQDPNDGDPCVPTPCTDCTLTTIDLVFDNYPAETSWDIVDANGNVVFSGNGYSGTSASILICIPDGCYDFVINDSYGDGICCAFGTGSYTVTDDAGNVIASGGEFTTSESTNFCYDNTSGCTAGTACDDGDPCTTGDVLDASCNCAGTFADADSDGVCDANDQCPNFDDSLIGTACDDGDACTINDTVGSDCACAGTFADADNDGVCDANDICPGGDDTVDTDGDGIPDFCDTPDGGCTNVTNSFSNNPLTHSGNGSSSTTLSFSGTHQDVSFTISSINQKLNGQGAKRYIELVTVTYVDGNGITQLYGTFSGADVSSVVVDIAGVVQSVTVTLEDIYDGSTTSNMFVDFTTVASCEGDAGPPCDDADGDGVCDTADVCPGFDDNLIGTSCNDGDVCTTGDVWGTDCNCAGTFADADGDGVCDANDICPGGDDTVDTDGNGIPDACDNGGGDCTNVTAFDPTTLTHSGSGSSSSFVVLTNQSDATFTISDLGSKTNGSPNSRYVDLVTVSYVDGSGNTVVLGTYSGADVSTVDISIPGDVQAITVSLADGYDGNSGNISVNVGDVTTCQAAPSINPGDLLEIQGSLEVYPNPTFNQFNVVFDGFVTGKYELLVVDLLGKQHFRVNGVADRDKTIVGIDCAEWVGGVYFVRLTNQNGLIRSKRVVVTKE